MRYDIDNGWFYNDYLYLIADRHCFPRVIIVSFADRSKPVIMEVLEGFEDCISCPDGILLLSGDREHQSVMKGKPIKGDVCFTGKL